MLPDASLSAKLAALRQRFEGKLPALAAEIEAAWRAWRGAGFREAGGAEPLRQLVHRLAGTAGTYGLDEIAERAQRVEWLLDRGLGGLAGDAVETAAIDAPLIELLHACRRTAGVPEGGSHG